MSISGRRVLIHGVDMTAKIESFYETDFGYRVRYSSGYINTYTESEVRILSVKPFDISEHEFSDSSVRISNICASAIELAVDDCGIEHCMTQNKQDAIAIAKALGVTGEDLL